MKYKLSDLLPVIEETLSENREFTLPVTGTSMLPLLVEKRDSVVLKTAPQVLKKGDLPLYRRADGAFVLHRVIGTDKDGYIMCGDNQFDKEYKIKRDMIIGIVTSINRNGRDISAKAPLYKLYVFVWTSLINVRYPLRRLRRSAKQTDEAAAAVSGQNLTPKPCVPYLISLLRSAVEGTNAPPLPDNVNTSDVFTLAKQHKVANTAAYAVIQSPEITDELKSAFKKELYRVVQRRAAQEAALRQIEKLFTENEIEYCVLKGDALASLYPYPDMRFSLDSDIYVRPQSVPKAEQIMLSLGYTQEGEKNTKDIAFVKKPNITVEIHFDLNFETDLTHDYFIGLISRLVPCGDNPYKLKMTDEDLYIYIMGHTAHHFLVAGTGIRSILDDFILRTRLLPHCDTEYIQNQLEVSGLLDFAGKLNMLEDYWFGAGEYTETVRRLERYIIESGVFGTDSMFYVNSAVPQSKLGGSRAGYIIERIFPSKAVMGALFPIVGKLPVLLPVFWFIRLFKVLGNAGRVSHELAGVKAVDKDKLHDRSNLFEEMGFR